MPKAPLLPLPIIGEPFQKIAMDIVRLLPRSGNCYVLVMCDYATQYPEAIALRRIDAELVAEELIKVFSRVGVPQEILTDQRSNFTSQLLAELYQLLHVHPIRTSPYHPQTDGLVEHFNQTLKAMLRKTATSEGKDWDKLLPYVLFAYREVPQASTGFSPFELLYGWNVRGPLDVLRETEGSVPYTLDQREVEEHVQTSAAEPVASPLEPKEVVRPECPYLRIPPRRSSASVVAHINKQATGTVAGPLSGTAAGGQGELPG